MLSGSSSNWPTNGVGQIGTSYGTPTTVLHRSVSLQTGSTRIETLRRYLAFIILLCCVRGTGCEVLATFLLFFSTGCTVLYFSDPHRQVTRTPSRSICSIQVETINHRYTTE